MTTAGAPSPSAALCSAADSRLVLIDVQTRLASAMRPEDRERVIKNGGVLLQGASRLGIPIVVTEQYPKGLGPTEAELAGGLDPGTAVVEKSCFACGGAEQFREVLAEEHRPQVVLAGMESHVCVLQTALSLLVEGYTVFVIKDACCSRAPANHHNAMSRLRRAGVIVTNTESVVFEWLRDAAHPHFKTLSALIK